jgi:hypothetical protein
MTRFMCVQCGTQFAETPPLPLSCPICEDERQYVRWSGQEWTTFEELRAMHRNVFTEEGGLTGIGIDPDFAIGQRALVIPAGDGAILWDCVSLVTEEAVQRIRRMGGLKAIAISHPHFYSAHAEWSEAFGGVPVYLHEDDRSWVMNPHGAIRFWSGETLEIAPGFTLIRTGGHFEGSTVLHHAAGSPPCQLHAQLSQLHSAQPQGRGTDRRRLGPLPIRADLRGLRAPQHPAGRQGGGGSIY